MANVITSGLYALKVGDPAGNGGMGTSLAILGYTREGSASFVVAAPDETPLMVEESDYPLRIKKRQGVSQIKWQVVDPDCDILVKTCGGTAAVVTVAAWATATSYKIGDFVLQSTIYYRCKVDHTSAAGSTPPNSAYWEPLVAQPKKWSSPLVPPTIEQSIQEISQEGFGFNIILASISGSINHEMSKTGFLVVDITATVLKPKLAGQAPIEYIGG